MTLAIFASAFTGILQIAVPSYGLRLSRRFGVQQVGWALVAAFVGLAAFYLVFGPAPAGGFSDRFSYRSLVGMVIPILLLVGLAHVEALSRERARAEAERRSSRGQRNHLLDLRTEQLAEAKAGFEQELRRRDLEQRTFREKAEQERLESATRVAVLAGQHLNRFRMITELYSKLLRGKTSDPKADHYRERLLAQTADAQRLAYQLLACGCCQPIERQLISLTALLHEHLPALRNLLGADQTLECTCAADALWVWADPQAVRWMLDEMVRNARMAMPENGRVSISVQKVVMESPHPGQDPDMREFCAMMVSDTGCGMTRESQNRIGEPFFTTEPGKRNGLGLASVSGLMKEHRGWLAVSSAPGHGTKVTLWFPQGVTQPSDLLS